MKCIILLTLVALCYSYPYGSGYGSGYGYGSWLGSHSGSGKNFNVNQDGSITITTTNGKTITISKGIGQDNVIVDVTGPTVSGNPYYFGYQKHQPSQVDTLAQILTQYQGDINQNTYQQLLGDVNYAVQTGQLSNNIFETLQNLNQIQNQMGQMQGQVVGGQTGQQQWQALQQARQLLQHNQWNQQGLHQQFPYWQTTGMVQDVVVPLGVNQQGQIVEKVFLQGPQTTYPTFGSQGVYGQQTLGGINFAGTGKSNWNTLINRILYGNGQQNALHYGQYGQYQVGPFGQTTPGHILHLEGTILNQQNQIHQEQVMQHQQQQQMLHQQFHQQQQQQQLQGQQQFVQKVQEQVQEEQEQVLGHQQQLHMEEQEQKYNTLMKLFRTSKPFIQTGGQQTGFWQQQPGVYSQGGLYGVYGQGIQHHNIPLVF